MDVVDLGQYVVLGATIVGITELINRLRAKDYWVAVTIGTAAVIGGLFGFIGYYPGMDVAEGIVAGFAAAGALKTLSTLGQKSTPAPSSVIEKN